MTGMGGAEDEEGKTSQTATERGELKRRRLSAADVDHAVNMVHGARPSDKASRCRKPVAPLDGANFGGLVLGCIEAKFCKKICV